LHFLDSGFRRNDRKGHLMVLCETVRREVTGEFGARYTEKPS